MIRWNRETIIIRTIISVIICIWIFSPQAIKGKTSEYSSYFESTTFHNSSTMGIGIYNEIENELEAFRKAVKRLNKAVIEHKKEVVLEQKKVFSSWLGDSTLAPFAHYYVSYCNYRLNTNFLDERDDIDDALVEEAMQHLEASKDYGPLRAEALALQSSFFGMKIGGPFSVMRYGSKANDAIAKALELEPDNPRVKLLDAIGIYYKPSFAGGGVEKSIKGLKKAIELFENSDSESDSNKSMGDLISWGRAESYAWLGKIYIEEEKWSKAHDMLSKALDINKDYHWIYDELNHALPDSLQFNDNL